MKIEIDKQLAVLKPEKQEIVLHAFGPIVQDLNDLGLEYPTIQNMEQSPERSARAKRFRIDFKKAVNQADAKRKDLKEESLQESKAIQNVFNYIRDITAGTLEEAICIEKYYENLKIAEQEKLRKERLIELEKYEMDGTALNLGEMDSAIWENFLLGAKRGFEEKQQAEKDEADRIAEQLRIENLHRQRKNVLTDFWQFIPTEIKTANYGILTPEQFKSLLDSAKVTKADYDIEQKQIREENEKLREENEKAENKRIADKKRSDAKLQKEREQKQKLEAEIAERNRLKAEEARAIENAPDREKIENLTIQISNCRDQVENTVARDVLYNIITELESMIEKM